MTYGEAEKMVKKTLSKKRFTHTVNVKDKAVELARLYGARGKGGSGRHPARRGQRAAERGIIADSAGKCYNSR